MASLRRREAGHSVGHGGRPNSYPCAAGQEAYGPRGQTNREAFVSPRRDSGRRCHCQPPNLARQDQAAPPVYCMESGLHEKLNSLRREDRRADRLEVRH